MNDYPVNTDPLDAAYLAIGAARALDAMTPEEHRKATEGGGELDLIRYVIEFAPVLQRAWEEVAPEGVEGVWAYEVAEPLGTWLASGGSEDVTRGAALDYARHLIADLNR